MSLTITSAWQNCPRCRSGSVRSSLEPSGPERGHVWHWQDVYPELARSRQFAADTASLQRRALVLCNPGLTPPAAGATPTIAAAYQMLFPGESAPVHAHSISAVRFGLAGSGARMIIDGTGCRWNRATSS
jgi:gentisate 1,2-dioxygenase